MEFNGKEQIIIRYTLRIRTEKVEVEAKSVACKLKLFRKVDFEIKFVEFIELKLMISVLFYLSQSNREVKATTHLFITSIISEILKFETSFSHS